MGTPERGQSSSGQRKIWAELSPDFYEDDGKQVLMRVAAFQRDHGLSHRNPPFLVGCVLLFKQAFTGEYGIWQTHNRTPEPGEKRGGEKWCAERSAVMAALNDGCDSIVAIVTVSKEVTTGDEVNKSPNVLHPCRECRDMMRELKKKGILRGESIIVNANDSKLVDGKWAEEERTVDELLDLYQDDEGEPQPQGLPDHSQEEREGIARRKKEIEELLMNLSINRH